MATAEFYVIFRFFHILGGVLWVGSAFLFVAIIGPSAAEVGPSAVPLLTVAVRKRKVVRIITGLSYVTVLAGWTLWIKDMTLYDSLGNWLSTRFGLVLTIGGVLATASAVVGEIGVGRNVGRLVELGNEMAAAGVPPSPDQQAGMERLSSSLELYGKIDLVLLLLAVTAMATARYL